MAPLEVPATGNSKTREDENREGVLPAENCWWDHFGLVSEPFSLTPDPTFLFPSDSHVEALAGLKLGLLERRGLIVLVGEVGTGKTTVVYSLLSNLDFPTETAYVCNTSLPFQELLKAALTDFGVEPSGTTRLELLEHLNGLLRRCSEQGKTAALVIDEAQHLSDSSFEELRLLLNFETYKSKLLQIVLVGQPELGERLCRHELRQLADRVAVRCDLKPLSRRETRLYVDHRLRAAGGSSGIFTKPALSLLVRKSRGYPRRVNILAHNAMMFAYGEGRDRVRYTSVAEAVRDEGWKRRRRGRPK